MTGQTCAHQNHTFGNSYAFSYFRKILGSILLQNITEKNVLKCNFLWSQNVTTVEMYIFKENNEHNIFNEDFFLYL